MEHDSPLDRNAVHPGAVSRVVLPSLVDEFLSERAGLWASTMSEDGPPVRVNLPALLRELRRS